MPQGRENSVQGIMRSGFKEGDSDGTQVNATLSCGFEIFLGNTAV